MNTIARTNQSMQARGLADRSRFFLHLADHADDTCLVTAVATQPNAGLQLHQDYRLDLSVVFKHPIDTLELSNTPATFQTLSGGSLVPLHGIIAEVHDAPPVGGHEAHRLVLTSALGLLKHQRHNRAFAHRDALSVARDVLTEQLSHLCHLDISADTPVTRKLITQYHETDYDFLRRILAREGIFIHLSERKDQTHIELTDDLKTTAEAEEVIALPYHHNTGAARDADHIADISKSWLRAPGRVLLNDDNPDTLADLRTHSSTDTLGSAGDAEHWGLNYETSDQGTALAERIARAHHWQNSVLDITTTFTSLRPGNRLTISQHPEHKGDFHVLSVSLSGDQTALSGGSGQQAFSCVARVIPADVDFVPEQIPIPGNASLFTARITHEVDTDGKYRFKYPFDHSDATESSPPTRLMQPFGGADHGMHFPLQEDTEVVVSALNGDLDRPVIMGALYNRNSPNPVNSQNARQNIIRTRSGHEFRLDDTEGREHIHLTTADHKNRLYLDNTTDQHLIELHTEEGDLELYAGQNMRFTSGKSSTLEVGSDHHVTVAGDQTLQTEEGSIVHEAGTDLTFTAGEAMHWRAEDGEVRLHSGADMTLSTDGQRFDHVQGGNLNLQVDDGDCVISAGGDVSINSEDTLTFTAGSCTLQLGGGDLTLEADNLEFTADSIAVKGSTVGNN